MDSGKPPTTRYVLNKSHALECTVLENFSLGFQFNKYFNNLSSLIAFKNSKKDIGNMFTSSTLPTGKEPMPSLTPKSEPAEQVASSGITSEKYLRDEIASGHS